MAQYLDHDLVYACRPVTEYGCVRCQKWHRQGLDGEEFQLHIFSMARNGVMRQRLPDIGEVFRRLVEGC